MPQFRVLTTMFINNNLAQAGDIVDFEGDFDPAHLEPLDKKAAGKGKGKGKSKDAQAPEGTDDESGDDEAGDEKPAGDAEASGANEGQEGK